MSGFQNPVRVRFGTGCLAALPEILGGRRALLVTTPGMRSRGAVARVEDLCAGRIEAVYAEVSPNPTVADAERAARELAAARAEVVVALGGGSALDTAKAVAAQRHPELEPGWLAAHLRGERRPPPRFAPAPLVAIPTTAGSGSEVTMWATLWDEKSGEKRSLAHPALHPEWALADPELTLGLPRELTVTSALDALSHACEAIWNRSANPVSDALAARAIAVIPGALRAVLARPGDLAARAALQEASLLAGLASSNTRTALAHSISYPLTARLGVPHGLACSLALPALLRRNGREAPDRCGAVARALGAASLASAADALAALLREVGAPALLRRHLPDPAALRELRAPLLHPGRAENNLARLDESEARALLEGACRELLTR